MTTFFNTLSNVAYLLLGIAIAGETGWGPLPVALVVLAVGSALFHAFWRHRNPSVRYWTHLVDEIGMYAVFSSILLLIFGIDD